MPNSLVVIATTTSSDDVSQSSQKLRDSGVSIFVVALGEFSDAAQFSNIASDPDSQHLYLEDYESLYNVALTIKDRICESKKHTYAFAVFVISVLLQRHDI